MVEGLGIEGWCEVFEAVVFQQAGVKLGKSYSAAYEVEVGQVRVPDAFLAWVAKVSKRRQVC